MDCNKEEALKAMDIAEKKMESKDFRGARKFALKAQQLYPNLENIAQILFVCDVHCSAEQRLSGNERDWYRILQIEMTANDATIKKQYRKFALQLHPDKNKFAGAEAAFQLIGEAQRVLLDSEKRSEHDMKHRDSMNRTVMPSHHHQKFPMNFNSVVQTNVRPNFSNLKPRQQQQPWQPAQQGLNGGSPTFSTVCPFCSVKYQYSRELLYRSLRCENCNRPFVAYEVDMQGTTPTTNSSQQAFVQPNGLNHGTFKVDVGSQGNLHTYRSNTVPYVKKDPTSDASRKPNGKRRKKEVAESSESFDSMGNTDSEEDMFADNDGFPGVQNHSNYREERTRRSTRQTHQVSYKENVSDDDDNFLQPSKWGKGSGSRRGAAESCGKAGEMDYHNGLAADLKNDQKEVKLKHNFYSEVSLMNQNVETNVRGKAMGDSIFYSVDHIDDCSAPSASTAEAIEIPDPQFCNFDAERSFEKFQIGQIWAFYSDDDGLPKYYGLIKRIGSSPNLELHVIWLTCCRLPENAIRWEHKDMVISCGRFEIDKTGVCPAVYTNTDSVSHQVLAYDDVKNKEYVIFPRKGEVWALYRKWTTKIKRSDLGNWEYDIVEVLVANDRWIEVLVLELVGGFNSVFKGKSNEGSAITMRIHTTELLKFSHQIPAFKLTEEHGNGNLKGFWELDPGALPIHYFNSK